MVIRRLRKTHSSASPKPRVVLSLGMFDGLHLGHQSLIAALTHEAKKTQAESLIIIFSTHPQAVLSGSAPKRLMNLRTQAQYLSAMGIDRLYYLPFDQRIADLPPQTFIQEYLLSQFEICHWIVGDDFRFGQNRSGNFELIQKLGQTHGFSSTQVSSHLLHVPEPVRVSSSFIRTTLEAGDFDTTHTLLGRPYSLVGRVLRGDQRGRQLGFPTLNLRPPEPTVLRGVYAVYVKGLKNEPLTGVANIGTRPTMDGHQRWLEVHIFDYHEQVYGQVVEVIFVAKLRDEIKFESLPALVSQIHTDCEMAKAILKHE